MFIWKDTQKRCWNPYAPFVDAAGTKHRKVPQELYEEIPDPVPPADYSEDTHFRIEIDDAPYVVFEPKSAAQVAAIRWERLKQIRDELTEHGGCLVHGKWFHSDAKSKQQQMALTMVGAALPANLQWKTMDGSFITLSPQIVAELFAAQMQREQTIFAVAEAKRLDNSPLYDGWPARYVPPEVV